MSANPEPTALHAPTCLGETGTACSAVGPGHAMHPVQRAVAAATPSGWVDAVVGRTTADGWTALHAVDDGRELAVWHHAPLTDAGAGAPVALHATYHVLAAGGQWLNVLVGDGR
jgi:hypothetical protein